MVDTDDQPAFEPTLLAPEGGGPHELHVRHGEAALASHVVSIDDHGAGAARKLEEEVEDVRIWRWRRWWRWVEVVEVVEVGGGG